MGVNLIPVHAIDVNAWYSQDYHLMGNLVTSANCFHLTEGFYLGYMDNTFPNSLYIAVHVLVCLRFSLNARSPECYAMTRSNDVEMRLPPPCRF